MRASAILLFLLFSLLAGDLHADHSPGAEPAAAAPLRIGIFPRRNATTTVSLFKPLADHLSARLGRGVELVTAKDFPAFWEGVIERSFDLVHFNQYHYVKSHAESGYEVVLANEEFGEAQIAGAIYVRRDGGTETLADLRGRTIVFGGDRTAMMSYIVPTDLLRSAGLQPGEYTEEFAISPPNAVFSVYLQQAQAAGAGEVVWKLPMVTKRIDVAMLRQLAVGEPLPQLPWAVRGGLDAGLRQRIVAEMLALNESEEGRALLEKAQLSGIHAIDDAAYDGHRRIIARVLDEHY